MLLAIDVGNTQTVFGLFDGDVLTEQFRVGTNRAHTGDEIAVMLRAFVDLESLAGIVLVLLKASPSNSIVSDVHGWARSLAGPFDGIFSFHNARVAITVNWGIAAVVYLFVGGLIARLIGRARH